MLYAGEGEGEGERLVRLGAGDGGVVRDRRIGRALWEGYLGQGKVASEQLRGRVCEGLEGVKRRNGVVGESGWVGLERGVAEER